MHPALASNLFLVKEHVGAFKAANEYDIYDPETGDLVMLCREPGLNLFTKLLRFTDWKRYTPFDVVIMTPRNEQLVRVTRGFTFIRSTVSVLDHGDRPMGSFRQKLLSVGGAFDLRDQEDRVLCSLVGKWTSWDFQFKVGDREVAHVSKKWAGIGRELFTSADNYMLQIADDVPPDAAVRQLILAAVVCIDMVLKE